jgi:hypothetical protein
MRIAKILSLLLMIVIALSACRKEKTCENLMFGIPNNKTGLSTSTCKPLCECGGFASTTFTQAQLDALRTWVLDETIPELVTNPYSVPVPNIPDGVCAVKVLDFNAKVYSLENYITPEAALADGAILTHFDACGKCSTLQDFVVYADNIDIGTDVRQCIISNFNSPFDTLVTCIERLGFTRPCAQIWA